jgi:uncharacterized protein
MVALLVAWMLVVAVASAAQAVAGFGSALLAVPLLSALSDAPTAVVGTALASLVPTAVNTLRDRRYVRWPLVGLLLATAVTGMPFGLLVLRRTPERGLSLLVAGVVAVATLLVWRPSRLAALVVAKRASSRGSLLAVSVIGVVTGVLTTATGTNGPPLVTTLRAMDLPPRALRATLAAVFVGTGLVGAAGFVLAGAVTHRIGVLALAAVPASVLGWLGGDRIFVRLDRAAFQRVLLGALATACCVAIVHAAL